MRESVANTLPTPFFARSLCNNLSASESNHKPCLTSKSMLFTSDKSDVFSIIQDSLQMAGFSPKRRPVPLHVGRGTYLMTGSSEVVTLRKVFLVRCKGFSSRGVTLSKALS